MFGTSFGYANNRMMDRNEDSVTSSNIIARSMVFGFDNVKLKN